MLEGPVVNPLLSWFEEQRSAYLYRACAEAESGTVRAELFQRLAGEAQAQAAIWRAQITARGNPPPPPYEPDSRTVLVARLVRWLGPRRMKGMLAAMKVRGMSVYGTSLGSDSGHAMPTPKGGIEHRHRNLGGGGNLRAAVFGVNDGLVSNASLILGVAGASTRSASSSSSRASRVSRPARSRWPRASTSPCARSASSSNTRSASSATS